MGFVDISGGYHPGYETNASVFSAMHLRNIMDYVHTSNIGDERPSPVTRKRSLIALSDSLTLKDME